MAGTTVVGGAVANPIRVTLEIRPKGKKVVAVAPDWPGLARGTTTEKAAIERLLAYVPRYAACWAFFDDVRSRVSAEMKRGPRGGGRDRARIVRHTLAAEQDWAKKLGVLTSQDAMLTDEGLDAHRDAYCNAIRALHAQNKMAHTWPLRYLIRHTAFHTLDPAWEMEDKDLTAK